MQPIRFEIEKEEPGMALRAGLLHTPHGTIQTPAFTAVGTKATVKGLTPAMLDSTGLQVLIANTYHLYLQPGEETVAKMGGLHAFMNWQKPIMTDSGGFQVFSLGEGFGKKLSKFLPEEVAREEGVALYSEELATSHGRLAVIDEDGVSFTSHIDGKLHRFTPERSMEIQHKLGADIMYAFDECTSPAADHAYQKEAMDRTHRWAKRSLLAHLGNSRAAGKQGLFGIVQGGRFADLRTESARALADMDFDGYGIGGSFSKHDILGTLDIVNSILPKEKPRHLLGIGEPEDIFVGVASGIDTFDCVIPTRNGRSGSVLTTDGRLNIDGASFIHDAAPIDSRCSCYACLNFTRSYINHLFRGKEMLGPMLASLHNMHFLVTLVRDIRASILDGRFEDFRNEFLGRYRKSA
jgi:queuine tRNA-ribosyltransferase